MPRIVILRRSLQVRPREGGGVREVAGVTYSTHALPPRIVELPPELYRDATEEELRDHPHYAVVPVSAEAVEEERRVLGEDNRAQFRQVPDSFEA